MWVVAFFGMSSKFTSCTLAQIYRRVTPEAKDHGSADPKHKSTPGRQHVLGGPMVYLTEGIKDVLGPKAKVLGVSLSTMFAFFAIMGSLGGGNMFQGNQTFAIFSDVLFEQKIENQAELETRIKAGDASAKAELNAAQKQAAEHKEELKRRYDWVGGAIMTILVGMVIVGGIKRIGHVTEKLVPAMCLFFIGVCMVILVTHVRQIPTMIASIFNGAFNVKAMGWGGLIGVLVTGVRRGAFSNEAGLGSASIAHSAAKTDEPVREGLVAMLGPFIDTIVVCTMTALAILITGAHEIGAAGTFSNEGVGITATAFNSLSSSFTYMLTIAVFIFAYSTMISWSYYGERASEYLFGHKGIKIYRVVFLFFVFISPMISLKHIIEFTDLLILSMAYPNILGMVILSGKVAKRAKDYRDRLKSGAIKPIR
jgi:AGCS family alanine or glycine:cation symporter